MEKQYILLGAYIVYATSLEEAIKLYEEDQEKYPNKLFIIFKQFTDTPEEAWDNIGRLITNDPTEVIKPH